MPVHGRFLMRLAAVFTVTVVAMLAVSVVALEAKLDDTEKLPSRAMEGVEEVNSENYYDVVGHDRYVLLEFYADWCGYCQDFSSMYEEYGMYVQSRPELVERVILAKVNSPENPRIQRRYGVRGYPTVLLVPPHSHTGVEFRRSRDFNELVDFVEKQLAMDALKD
ncbi:hypothetical protein ABL78_4944 [Leptomonas seymouri]|uniref:Thioredoxin domain-containing protein n=1 Tax=Leptomonas seymouri TaxID=5684 RepID=A0A0N1IJS7_LEPSE|nr:hypothetical protein ABL78_4944 [Leptomonas seymouri]|eukprot:KPI85982.1 hypothetical protein ABL78_4944 [Leptomonas seymouri]